MADQRIVADPDVAEHLQVRMAIAQKPGRALVRDELHARRDRDTVADLDEPGLRREVLGEDPAPAADPHAAGAKQVDPALVRVPARSEPARQ